MKNLSLIFLCIALSTSQASFAMNANGKRPAEEENPLFLLSRAITQAAHGTAQQSAKNDSVNEKTSLETAPAIAAMAGDAKKQCLEVQNKSNTTSVKTVAENQQPAPITIPATFTECPTCKTTHRNNVRPHLLNCHKMPPSGTSRCNTCSILFSEFQALRNHVVKKHLLQE